MVRKSLTIALAFVGLLVGAGFASGQEVIQYFIAFGYSGLIGVIVAGIVMTLSGGLLFQLGSYYLAGEHSTVFRNATHPIVSRFLDITTMLTLFCIGFVMLAGAGSNLEQQFDTPTWLGSFIMVVAVIVSGFLDVDKVTNVISAITPLIIIAVIAAGIITILNMPSDTSVLEPLALEQNEAQGVLGNWILSAVNYTAMALMLGLSMILVIGGNYFNPREAGVGGLLGGFMFSALLAILAFILFFNLPEVDGNDFPLLAVFDSMHPAIGVIVSLILYAMIYNTAIGMFYALGRRLSAGHEGRFRVIFIVVTLIGFVISFAGFTDLIGWVYPLIGYIGIAMLIALGISWLRNRKRISSEISRRKKLAQLAELDLDPDEGLSKQQEQEVRELAKGSLVDGKELWPSVQEEVAHDLDSSGNSRFDADQRPDLKQDD
ncbi:hypothetical protein C3B44_06635 [Corynebacterium yudongzhengii]|uniref:Membrane protein YkvI n=1 Tax=Corynebacterium yudongzhengii TaxID=2080740 RepID=A0A2U1T989_9CORY|nr:hypothetical protein [Corynebacterium yudongzhengii]AWB82067.1 hypothetical protein C3B44_06635 [Corynebacterium yudongzhengii]PWC02571.1 hypothetical protein DF222_01105 [Corynebacterium yudongzhengii]